MMAPPLDNAYFLAHFPGLAPDPQKYSYFSYSAICNLAKL